MFKVNTRQCWTRIINYQMAITTSILISVHNKHLYVMIYRGSKYTLDDCGQIALIIGTVNLG